MNQFDDSDIEREMADLFKEDDGLIARAFASREQGMRAKIEHRAELFDCGVKMAAKLARQAIELDDDEFISRVDQLTTRYIFSGLDLVHALTHIVPLSAIEMVHIFANADIEARGGIGDEPGSPEANAAITMRNIAMVFSAYRAFSNTVHEAIANIGRVNGIPTHADQAASFTSTDGLIP